MLPSSACGHIGETMVKMGAEWLHILSLQWKILFKGGSAA